MKNSPKQQAINLNDIRKMSATPYEIMIAGNTDLMKNALTDIFSQGFNIAGLRRIMFVLIVAVPVGIVVYYFLTGGVQL